MMWSLRLDSSLRSARMCNEDHARAPEDIEWGAREAAIQADLQRDYDAMVERCMAWLEERERARERRRREHIRRRGSAHDLVDLVDGAGSVKT